MDFSFFFIYIIIQIKKIYSSNKEMSLAFYASPIDYKNNDLENKIKSEKTKLDKNTLMTIQQGTLEQSPSNIVDIHKNLMLDILSYPIRYVQI
jgi:hypothetical protein